MPFPSTNTSRTATPQQKPVPNILTRKRNEKNHKTTQNMLLLFSKLRTPKKGFGVCFLEKRVEAFQLFHFKILFDKKCFMKCNKILKYTKHRKTFFKTLLFRCNGSETWNTSLFFYEYAVDVVSTRILCCVRQPKSRNSRTQRRREIFIYRQFYVIYIHCLIEFNAR